MLTAIALKLNKIGPINLVVHVDIFTSTKDVSLYFLWELIVIRTCMTIDRNLWNAKHDKAIGVRIHTFFYEFQKLIKMHC